jgi:hypothetical protein
LMSEYSGAWPSGVAARQGRGKPGANRPEAGVIGTRCVKLQSNKEYSCKKAKLRVNRQNSGNMRRKGDETACPDAAKSRFLLQFLMLANAFLSPA